MGQQQHQQPANLLAKRSYSSDDLKAVESARMKLECHAAVMALASKALAPDPADGAFPTTQPTNIDIHPYDVMCGRHKLAFNNIGNRRFRVTVSLFLHRYTESRHRLEKSSVIDGIVGQVHRNGGRFLKYKKENDEWYEISKKEAREKVGHALRDALANGDGTVLSSTPPETPRRYWKLSRSSLVSVLSQSSSISSSPNTTGTTNKRHGSMLDDTSATDSKSKQHYEGDQRRTFTLNPTSIATTDTVPALADTFATTTNASNDMIGNALPWTGSSGLDREEGSEDPGLKISNSLSSSPGSNLLPNNSNKVVHMSWTSSLVDRNTSQDQSTASVDRGGDGSLEYDRDAESTSTRDLESLLVTWRPEDVDMFNRAIFNDDEEVTMSTQA